MYLGGDMRRIITGHNKEGKSVVSIEGPPARSLGEEVGVDCMKYGIPMEKGLILNH